MKDKDTFLIKKKSLEVNMNKFLDKFPDYWTPSPIYISGLKDLVIYINKLKGEIEKLEIIKSTIQNVTYDFYNANNVKKLLNFNNY